MIIEILGIILGLMGVTKLYSVLTDSSTYDRDYGLPPNSPITQEQAEKIGFIFMVFNAVLEILAAFIMVGL